MPIYMSFKSVFERNPICILDKRHRHRENPKSYKRWVDHFPSVYRLSHVQPIKKPVRTLSIFMSMAFVKDANGISFKNRLKGHINWHKVKMGSGQPSVCTTSDFHAVLFWFVYDT
jgi:hypothetical protein